MTELTRGEKIRQTMIKNIMQQNPGMTAEEADKARIEHFKAIASRGGKNGTGHSFGHGSISPQEAGRIGGLAKRRKRESTANMTKSRQ